MELIYSFDHKHKPGDVCNCGGAMTTDWKGDILAAELPIYIIREATYEEYVASCIANAGSDANPMPRSSGDRYYAISMD
jgi:hypothetical protein